MSTIFQEACDAASRFLDFIHEHTKPNAKYFKDKKELELSHKRSKALMFNQAAIWFVFIINILTGNGELATNLQGLCSTSMLVIASFTLNHFHPEVFRIFFNFLMTLFTILLTKHDDEGLHGAWICTLNFPLLVYVATGSLWHFMINVSIQIVFLNTMYQAPMKRSMMFMDPDDFVTSLTYQTNQAIIYGISFNIFTHILMKQAFEQITVAEKKRDDFERQKNFLLGFSHELRNLINSLMGNVKLAAAEAVNDKAKDLLANAELCAEMLLHLIINILDTGKVELGDLEINPSPIKIYDIAERVWSVCSELIKNKNLRGRLRMHNNIPQVLTLDHYRMIQILLNLVGNSVKYTDVGDIDIGIEWINNTQTVTDACFMPHPFSEDPQDEGIFEKRQNLSVFDNTHVFLNFNKKKIDRKDLSSQIDSRQGILKIIVRDTGIGISKTNMERLFQKFTQVSSDPSRNKLGTGLGLFITKELCLRMNGDVRVFSQEGQGSAFIICLPVEPVTQGNEHLLDKELVRKFAMQKRLTAMIVDDQQFNHIILREFLNKLGVEVTEVAENGLVAYQKYSARANTKEYINLVTMDLNMPIMDGKTSVGKIRELEEAKGLDPCLMMMVSANCTESEIKDCIDKQGTVKADAFVKKPATVDELCEIVSSYLIRTYGEQEIRDFSLSHQ